MLIQDSDRKEIFPIVGVGEVIHFVLQDHCVPAIISGVPLDYEDSGELIIHPLIPSPGTPIVCYQDMVKFDDTKKNFTWHESCKCKAKRISVQKKSRLIH